MLCWTSSPLDARDLYPWMVQLDPPLRLGEPAEVLAKALGKQDGIPVAVLNAISEVSGPCGQFIFQECVVQRALNGGQRKVESRLPVWRRENPCVHLVRTLAHNGHEDGVRTELRTRRVFQMGGWAAEAANGAVVAAARTSLGADAAKKEALQRW